MEFRGYFHPAYYPRTTGFIKEGGEFWIGFINDEDQADGLIRIKLSVLADNADTTSDGSFASFHIHHDGLKVMRKLEEIGFLKMFEEIKASTFYDVVQCCVTCGVPIIYHGDYTREMTPRRIYEILYSQGE